MFNWLAIAAAAIIPLLIGFIWYHPKVFGNAWMNINGFTEEFLRKSNMPLIFGATFVLSFMLAMQMALLVSHGHEGAAEGFQTFKHGAFHGVLTALFSALPIIGINALFERRSWKYIAIHVGYWAITMALMGGLLGMEWAKPA